MPAVLASSIPRAAELFHALSDETRLEIIERLGGGERCVCELTDELDAAQSRLSFHLRVLRDAGLVADRREGRWSYYSLDRAALQEARDLIAAMLPRGRRATGATCSDTCCG